MTARTTGRHPVAERGVRGGRLARIERPDADSIEPPAMGGTYRARATRRSRQYSRHRMTMARQGGSPRSAPVTMSLSATLAHRPDAERVRLRLGTAFIEHVDDLWPESEPNATPIGSEPMSTKFSGCWSSCFAVTGAMCTDFRTALHWVLWLSDDLDVGAPLDC